VKTIYHLPTRADGATDLPPEERGRLERAILRAVERAVTKAAAPGAEVGRADPPRRDFREAFEHARHRPRAGTYSVPSYQMRGEYEEVPIEEQAPAATDKVVERPPPFQGSTVLALPGNRYVKVRSRRHVTSDNLYHAVVWGRLLFPTTSWVLASRAEKSGRLYHAAALQMRLTPQDLHVRPPTGDLPDITGEYPGRVLSRLRGGFKVEAVFLTNEEATAPTGEVLVSFFKEVRATQVASPGGALDPKKVRSTVFSAIDALLGSGESADLEKAADALAELDAAAFGLVDADTRVRYLSALVRAWTLEPQERAIVQIFKSVQDRSELDLVIRKLKGARLWDQLFDDLDSEVWSLLVTLGERFGPRGPLTLTQLAHLLLEAKLISVAPAVRLTATGPEFSIDLVADAYEAARGFVRFLGGALEGLWMLLSEPEKILEGSLQLVRMIVVVELARWGNREAQQTVARALAGAGAKVLNGLKGAALTGMGPAIQRRIKWALIWEIASWFVGAGEVKAALKAVGLTEHLQALGRILRVAGMAGKAAEAQRAAGKLRQLARLLSKAGKRLADEEVVLRALSRLPEEDVARLAGRLEKLELGEAADAAKLLKENPEIADALRKAEVLEGWAARAGGYSDTLTEAFARLSGPTRLTPDEIARLLKAAPRGSEARFARAVRAIPAEAFGPGGTASAEFLRGLAAHPAHVNALLSIGYGPFVALYRRAGGEAARLDQYLAALTDLGRRLPPANRALEYRRLLDQLERGDAGVWLQLEDARAGRFARAEARLEPRTIDAWIEEELKGLAGAAPPGASPIDVGGAAPAPPQAASFKEALARVDLSDMPAAEYARLRAGWRRYRSRGGSRLRTEDDYIRFVYGRRTGRLPRVVRGPRPLGPPGAVEQLAGHVLERAVNAHLPPGSRNVRDIPTRFGNVRPDHLPPGRRVIHLNPDGSVSAAGTGTPFSARFVADSKYREVIPTNDQTRGFVRLAALSDEKRLVFYVRWREHFGDPAALVKDPHVGRKLPARAVPQLVQSGVRDAARQAGVSIELISDITWK
jgi:hypothetical protein